MSTVRAPAARRTSASSSSRTASSGRAHAATALATESITAVSGMTMMRPFKGGITLWTRSDPARFPVRLRLQHRLVVQGGEGVVRIVGALERPIRRATVARVERVALIVAVGIQRLDPFERGHA